MSKTGNLAPAEDDAQIRRRRRTRRVIWIIVSAAMLLLLLYFYRSYVSPNGNTRVVLIPPTSSPTEPETKQRLGPESTTTPPEESADVVTSEEAAGDGPSKEASDDVSSTPGKGSGGSNHSDGAAFDVPPPVQTGVTKKTDQLAQPSPSPTVVPEPTPVPVIDEQFQEGINVKPLTPPQPTRELRRPKVPQESHKSLLSGKHIIVRIVVDARGEATVLKEKMYFPPGLPLKLKAIITQQIIEDIEGAAWHPAHDEQGEVYRYEVGYIYAWP